MDLDWNLLALHRDNDAGRVNHYGGQQFVCSRGLEDVCSVYVGYVPAIRSLIVKPVSSSSNNMDNSCKRRGGVALDANSIHVSYVVTFTAIADGDILHARSARPPPCFPRCPRVHFWRCDVVAFRISLFLPDGLLWKCGERGVQDQAGSSAKQGKHTSPCGTCKALSVSRHDVTNT